MQAPVHHIIGYASIIRQRLLPIPGAVLARINQRVSPNDIIAEAARGREHILLNVAQTLGVSPAAADRLIKCKAGDPLAANAEIAVGKGLFPRRVLAPREGKVILAGEGQVLMSAGEAKIELRAGIAGTVIELIPNRGAVIQAAGGLVQGVWGNGRIDAGAMVNLMEQPDSTLNAGRLDVSMRGMVILGGIVKDAETLNAAAEVSVRGLILSGLYPSLLPLAREMRYPILLTEGFGPMPMNSAAYKLLSTNAKREVTVNAESRDRYSGACPEVIIPLPVSADQQPPLLREVETLAPGVQVRMRRPPSAGTLGSITALKPGLTTFPSGLRAPAAEVKLENGETVIAPLVNLEVIG